MQTLTDEDFLKFLGKQESQFIIKPSEVTDEVIERFNGLATTGETLPWSKTHNNIQLRPGEVSLWGGYNGHGKSQFLGMVCAWGMKKSKWLIASMEMKPAATMHRITRQVAGNKNPDIRYIRGFMKWTDNRLWIYDQTDSVKRERIVAMVHYAASIGINHVIIDSLMKCGIATDDLNGQKDFVDRLCWAAKANNIHVHLIHHMRKGEDEYRKPGKHDFRGAGEITDLVDNVFIIHRNKRKEEKRRLEPEAENDKPDCTLTVAKQRHGEWEGVVAFWYEPESMQYTPNENNHAIPYEAKPEMFMRMGEELEQRNRPVGGNTARGITGTHQEHIAAAARLYCGDTDTFRTTSKKTEAF